jgi:DNA-binding transcriptional LysR family regulator
MNERDCQYFLHLYKTKNITHTAQQNFITQSSLTKLIQRLEAELGCQLLLRSQKGVVFTPNGEQLVQYCKKFLQMQQELKDNINRGHGVVCGSLSIGSSTNYSRYHLPTALKAYTTRYPAVDISIVTGHSRNLYNQLLDNKISIAIIRGDFKWDEGLLPLSAEPMCLIYHRKIKIADLNSLLYICHRTDSESQYQMNRWTVENDIDTRQTSIWIDDITSCMEMVQAGVGWSILPAICLNKFKGMILPLSYKDGTPLIRSTSVFYRNAQSKLPQVRLFLQTLQENEQQYPYALTKL